MRCREPPKPTPLTSDKIYHANSQVPAGSNSSSIHKRIMCPRTNLYLHRNSPVQKLLPRMCTKRMKHYAECNHTAYRGFNKCAIALGRPNEEVCVPASGHSRDLIQDLDRRDRDTPGKCPICKGSTPPSSAGSDGSMQ